MAIYGYMIIYSRNSRSFVRILFNHKHSIIGLERKGERKRKRDCAQTQSSKRNFRSISTEKFIDFIAYMHMNEQLHIHIIRKRSDNNQTCAGVCIKSYYFFQLKHSCLCLEIQPEDQREWKSFISEICVCALQVCVRCENDL